MLILGHTLLKETQPRTPRWQQAVKVILPFLKSRCPSLFQIFFQFFFLQNDSLLTTREKHGNLQQDLLVLQDWNPTTSEIKRYLIQYDFHFANNQLRNSLTDFNKYGKQY